jgi:hypothetical protein
MKASSHHVMRGMEVGIFGPVPGTWWIRSESDPRWSDTGSAQVGGFMRPSEVDRAIERLRKELGGEPPADLEWGYVKD